MCDTTQCKFAQRPRLQFSQKISIVGLMLVLLAWIGNFVLLWHGKEPMSDVTIAIITIFGGFSTCGYFALCCARDCSKNKHGVK